MGKFVDLVIYALAVWQTVEVIHHSELFAGLRLWADLESQDNFADTGPFVGRAIGCPFCLAHWVAIGYSVLLCTPLGGLVSWWTWVLAVVRLSNIGNDLIGDRCRTPRDYPDEADQKEQDGGNNNST
jgi:hypothetical protein